MTHDHEYRCQLLAYRLVDKDLGKITGYDIERQRAYDDGLQAEYEAWRAAGGAEKYFPTAAEEAAQ